MKIEEFIDKWKLDIPEEHRENIEFSTHGLYRYKVPLEAVDFPGFYRVPGFEDYVLNEKGLLLDTVTLRFRKWSLWHPGKKCTGVKSGYVRCKIRDREGIVREISRHRAMALIHCPFPETEERLVVNHKNGIPGDDRPENLEWATHKENSIHASDHGLTNREKSIPIIFRNRNTGEVKRFNSVKKCARDTGINHDLIYHRLLKPELEYSDGLDFKPDDGSPWPKIRLPRTATRHGMIISRNVFTGDIKIWKSTQEAVEILGLSRPGIFYHLREKKIAPYEGYNFRLYPEQKLELPIHPERSLEIFRANPNFTTGIGVIVKDLDGNELKFYTDTIRASEGEGLERWQIQRAILRKRAINGKRYFAHDVDKEAIVMSPQIAIPE